MSDIELKADPLAEREKWKLRDDWSCYFASQDNPVGLKINPVVEPGRVWAEFMITKDHTSWPGIAFGGIAASILDGVMGYYILAHTGRAAFTIEMNFKYYAPLRVGETYLFDAIKDRREALPGQMALVGRVHHKKTREENPKAKAMLIASASFILPNRDLAKAILQMDLTEDDLKWFPEKG